MSHLHDDAEPAGAPHAEPDRPGPTPPPPYRLDLDDPGAPAQQNSGVRIARISGDLDYVVTPALRRRLLEQLPAIEMLVLDLTEVTLLSAAAIEMLLDLDDMSVPHGVHVRIVAATRAVLRPLQLTGVDRRLSLYPSSTAALEQD